MSSPFEERAVDQIANEQDIGRRAEHLAVLACYLARIGDFAKAEEIRCDLRKAFGGGEYPRASILLMLLEGLIVYFRNLDSKGVDRIFRAKVISEFVQARDLISLTSAWLAHMYFNQSNWLKMEQQIKSTFAHIASDDGSALCRISLVLGNAFLIANQPLISNLWYATARLTANNLGDRSVIGAITYNSAAFDLQNYRILDGDKLTPPKGVELVKTKIDTAINYDNLVELKSLSELAAILRCGIDVLQRDFVRGALGIDGFFREVIFDKGNQQHIRLAADMSWCMAACGDKQSSEDWQNKAIAGRSSLTDLDDEAIAYFSLSRASAIRGDENLAAEQRVIAKTKSAAYKRYVSKITSILNEYVDPKKFVKRDCV